MAPFYVFTFCVVRVWFWFLMYFCYFGSFCREETKNGEKNEHIKIRKAIFCTVCY